jgi:uncharacterized membrane protein
MKPASFVSLLVIIVSFVVAFYFYPILPNQIVSHWGANGEPNGYSGKAFGLFFLPILLLIMTGLFLLIPKIDPLKKNIETFRKYFDGFIIAIEIFLLYIYCLTIAFNLGYKFDLLTWMMPAFAVLFYYIGVLISKAKRNYFIGIRTPWTLASDKVWEKTHKLGGTLFKLGALPFLFSIFYPVCGFVVFITYIIAISIWLCVYSYIEFQKEPK